MQEYAYISSFHNAVIGDLGRFNCEGFTGRGTSDRKLAKTAGMPIALFSATEWVIPKDCRKMTDKPLQDWIEEISPKLTEMDKSV